MVHVEQRAHWCFNSLMCNLSCNTCPATPLCTIMPEENCSTILDIFVKKYCWYIRISYLPPACLIDGFTSETVVLIFFVDHSQNSTGDPYCTPSWDNLLFNKICSLLYADELLVQCFTITYLKLSRKLMCNHVTDSIPGSAVWESYSNNCGV